MMGSGVCSSRAPKSRLCTHCNEVVEKHTDGGPVFIAVDGTRVRRLLHHACKTEYFRLQQPTRASGGQSPKDVPDDPTKLLGYVPQERKAMKTVVPISSAVASELKPQLVDVKVSRGQRINLSCPVCGAGKIGRVAASLGVEIRICRAGHSLLVDGQAVSQGDNIPKGILIPRSWADRLSALIRSRSAAYVCLCGEVRTTMLRLFQHLHSCPKLHEELLEVKAGDAVISEESTEVISERLKNTKLSELVMQFACAIEEIEDRLSNAERQLADLQGGGGSRK